MSTYNFESTSPNQESATKVITQASVDINTKGGGVDNVTKEKLKAINPKEWNAALDTRRENLHDLLSKIAKNPKHSDKDFATAYLAKLDAKNKKDVKMKDVLVAQVAAAAVASQAIVQAPALTSPAVNSQSIMQSYGNNPAAIVPGVNITTANNAPTTAEPKPAKTPKMTPITTVVEANTRIEALEKQANELADKGEDTTTIEAQIMSMKRRLAILQKGAKIAETKAYNEAKKNTTSALDDARVADTFIADNFAPVEIGNQTYYIANKVKSGKVAEMLKTDNSTLRNIFVQKMGAVMVKISGQDYPAISTRDGVLGKYKLNESKESLKNAVAFDEKQYDKVLKELKDIQASPADVAKNLSQKFIKTVQSDPEKAKVDLKKAIVGIDPHENIALEKLLQADFANPLIEWTDPKLNDKITTTITAILNNKSPAFVMNQYGVAFDGVSLVPGAMVRGKIEGKETTDGFYETKSSTIDTFLTGLSDPDSKLKTVLTAADGRGPIEFGGKILEVKNGQVLSLGKPEKVPFTMRDLVGEYSTKDGVRDAIIVALVLKVWGVPHISMSLPSISLSLPSLSLPKISLPHLSPAATGLLVGFGLGWFVARLVYGDDAKVGADAKQYSKYQNAYNTVIVKKESQGSRQVGDTEYKHMSWDTENTSAEKNDKAIKIYRPLGKPETIGGAEILAFAIGVNGKVDETHTLVKVGNETKSLSTMGNKTDIIRAIEE